MAVAVANTMAMVVVTVIAGMRAIASNAS
jgi:hypothetical protein